MTEPNYKGEAQLLSWSTSPAGRKITLLLPEDTPDHPFKGFKTGPKYGQCFAIMTQPIDYDNPEGDGQAVKSVKGYTTTESQRCAMLCHDERFREWIIENYTDHWRATYREVGESDGDLVAKIVRTLCGMASRSALDSDPEGEPSQRWQRLKAKYYSDTGKVAERTR